ncbi:MAG: XRE family transcriptional regulator [Thermomonospora sp. CIF 1]|nr:MAG: XRE family transcriptional regulator [Thermomonospora sp. CIF 1]
MDIGGIAMPDSPTARKRQLGIQLRKLREAAGLRNAELAELMGWSTTKMSRLETGQTTITAAEVEQLCDHLGVEDVDLRETLKETARKSRQRGWWQPFTKVLPKGFTVYIDLESAASVIHVFSPSFVPGLLQTPDYARAMFRTAPIGYVESEIDRLVSVRMARQEILKREADPPKLWAILDERALVRPIGGEETMNAQLRHLVECAAMPNVTIQLVPTEVGAYPSMGNGFSMLEFASTDQPVVHVDISVGGSMYLEEPAQIRMTRLTLDRLKAVALSPEASVTAIRRLVKDS